jgi:hypothetical protein
MGVRRGVVRNAVCFPKVRCEKISQIHTYMIFSLHGSPTNFMQTNLVEQIINNNNKLAHLRRLARNNNNK